MISPYEAQRMRDRRLLHAYDAELRRVGLMPAESQTATVLIERVLDQDGASAHQIGHAVHELDPALQMLVTANANTRVLGKVAIEGLMGRLLAAREWLTGERA